MGVNNQAGCRMAHSTQTTSPLMKRLLLPLIVLLAGCASSNEFIRDDVDLSRYQRIAVLPLNDHASERGSGNQVADIVSMNLLNSPITVVDRTQTIQMLAEQLAGSIGIIDESTAPEIGRILGVQALLTGSINEWQSFETNIQVVQGADPAMMPISAAGVSLKLIDVETGQVVWAGSARGTETGHGLQANSAQKAVRSILGRLRRHFE